MMSEIADKTVKNNLTLDATTASENDVNTMYSDVEMCQNLSYSLYGYNLELPNAEYGCDCEILKIPGIVLCMLKQFSISKCLLRCVIERCRCMLFSVATELLIFKCYQLAKRHSSA